MPDSTIVDRLSDLQQNPQRFEVLVDAGAYTLGEGERWLPVKKYRPQAKFQVAVACGTYRLGEIRGVREFGHA